MDDTAGTRIRQAREARGLTRDRLATDTGVSVTVIRRIETGHGGGVGSIIALETALGIRSPDQPHATPASVETALLHHVSDDKLQAEARARWDRRSRELSALRERIAELEQQLTEYRTLPPVIAPLPERLRRPFSVRNAQPTRETPQAAESRNLD